MPWIIAGIVVLLLVIVVTIYNGNPVGVVQGRELGRTVVGC